MTHREATRIRTQPPPRPRHRPGAGRAPARIPPAVRRRPRGAARSGPRRRSRQGRGAVMRRRPTAVYRVIDEEELLGGGAAVDSGTRPEGWRPPAGTPTPRCWWRNGWRWRTGWGSTALAVAALAAVAAALLSLGGEVGASHAWVAPAAASQRSGLRLWTASKRTSPRVAAVAGRRAATAPRLRANAPSTRRPGNADPRRVRRRAAARQTRTSAGSPPAATAAPADPAAVQAGGPAAEFGFER
jgi:hypothetical protein